MSSVDITGTSLTVRLSRFEKVFGLLRDQVVPLAAVTGVQVAPDGLAAARGLRAPGLAVPGRCKIGTWRGRGTKRLVCVRGSGPALVVRLTASSYDELVVSSGNAESLAARLRSVR